MGNLRRINANKLGVLVEKIRKIGIRKEVKK